MSFSPFTSSFSASSGKKQRKRFKPTLITASALFGVLTLLAGCSGQSADHADTVASSPAYQQALDICSQEADATLTAQNPMLNVSAAQQQQNSPGTVGRLRTFSYASLSFQSQRNKLINACLRQKGFPPQSW